MHIARDVPLEKRHGHHIGRETHSCIKYSGGSVAVMADEL